MKDLSIITPIIADDINYKFLRLYRSINNQNIIRKISWILVGDRNACIKFKKLNLKSNKIKITFLTKSCNMAEATNFAIKKIKTDFWLSIGYDDQLYNSSVISKVRNIINNCKIFNIGNITL